MKDRTDLYQVFNEGVEKLVRAFDKSKRLKTEWETMPTLEEKLNKVQTQENAELENINKKEQQILEQKRALDTEYKKDVYTLEASITGEKSSSSEAVEKQKNDVNLRIRERRRDIKISEMDEEQGKEELERLQAVALTPSPPPETLKPMSVPCPLPLLPSQIPAPEPPKPMASSETSVFSMFSTPPSTPPEPEPQSRVLRWYNRYKSLPAKIVPLSSEDIERVAAEKRKEAEQSQEDWRKFYLQKYSREKQSDKQKCESQLAQLKEKRTEEMKQSKLRKSSLESEAAKDDVSIENDAYWLADAARKNALDKFSILRKAALAILCYPVLIIKDAERTSPIKLLLTSGIILGIFLLIPSWIKIPLWLAVIAGIVGYVRQIDALVAVAAFIPYHYLIQFVRGDEKRFYIWLVVALLLNVAAYVIEKKKKPEIEKEFEKNLEKEREYYKKQIAEAKIRLEKENQRQAEAEKAFEAECNRLQARQQELEEAINTETKELMKAYIDSCQEVEKSTREQLLQWNKEIEKRNTDIDEWERKWQAEVAEDIEKTKEWIKNSQNDIEKYQHEKHALELQMQAIDSAGSAQQGEISEKEASEKARIKKAYQDKQAERDRQIQALAPQRMDVREKYRKERERVTIEWREEEARKHTAYEQELQLQLAKLRKDGMSEVCGFNYVKAWSMLHAIGTNTVGFPAIFGTHMENEKVLKELVVLGIQKDTGKELNPEKCEFMPRHIIGGFECCEIDKEIKREIQKVLHEYKEYQGIEWADEIIAERVNVEELPTEIMKLKLYEMGEQPILIYYDAGDLDQDKGMRENIRDFILRNYAFAPYHSIGRDSEHYHINIITTKHVGDFENYDMIRNILPDGKCRIFSERKEITEQISTLYRNGQKVMNSVGIGGSLYEKNVARAEKGQVPADKYEILLIVNLDLKDLNTTKLNDILELQGIRSGIYPIIFVDMNRIEADIRGNADKTSSEAAVRILYDIANEGIIYEMQMNDREADLRRRGKVDLEKRLKSYF